MYYVLTKPSTTDNGIRFAGIMMDPLEPWVTDPTGEVSILASAKTGLEAVTIGWRQRQADRVSNYLNSKGIDGWIQIAWNPDEKLWDCQDGMDSYIAKNRHELVNFARMILDSEAAVADLKAHPEKYANAYGA